MKKFFTMLGAALMMGSVAANAETVTFDVSYWDDETQSYVAQEPFQSEVTRNLDGTLNIDKFMGGDYPVIIKFTEPSVGTQTGVEFVGGYITTRNGYPTYCSDKHTYPKLYSYSADGDKITIRYAHFHNEADYCYLHRDSQNEYSLNLTMSGTLLDELGGGDTPTFYITSTFAMPAIPEDGMTVYVCDENFNEVAESFKTQFVMNDDCTFTMTNFFNSYFPLSFTFSLPSTNEISTINFTGKVTYDGNEINFLTPIYGSDKYMICKLYPNGSETATSLSYPYSLYDYNYVEKLSASDKAVYGHDYRGVILFRGYDGSNWSDWYYLCFYFDIPRTDLINLYVEDYDGNELADSAMSGLVFNADGTITLTNLLNSGQPFSFNFNVPAVGGYADIQVTSPTLNYEGDIYLRNEADDDYLYCTAFNYDGNYEPAAFDQPFIFPDYSYVYRYDKSNPNVKYEYFATFYFYAWLGDDVVDYYVSVYFNLDDLEYTLIPTVVPAMSNYKAFSIMFDDTTVEAIDGTTATFECAEAGYSKQAEVKSLGHGMFTVEFDEAPAESGTYVLTIEEGAFGNSAYMASGYKVGKANTEINNSYTVKVTGIDNISSDSDVKAVYNLMGVKVADSTDNLPAGIYIVNGKKVVVK